MTLNDFLSKSIKEQILESEIVDIEIYTSDNGKSVNAFQIKYIPKGTPPEPEKTSPKFNF